MRLITRKPLVAFAERHADARGALDTWERIVLAAHWRDIQQVRRSFPHADAVIVKSGRPVIVFNISGNKRRIISAIHFNRGIVYLLFVLTRAEYDKNLWKAQ